MNKEETLESRFLAVVWETLKMRDRNDLRKEQTIYRALLSYKASLLSDLRSEVEGLRTSRPDNSVYDEGVADALAAIDKRINL